MPERPSIEFYEPRKLGDKPWGVELLFAETPLYIGKLLFMEAGKGGNLQYHEKKDETFYLVFGSAELEWEAHGTPQKTALVPGMSVHVPPGAIHAVTATTACLFVEASNPVFDDRVIVEDRGVHS